MERHERAAQRHERAAERHAQSARFWDDRGHPAMADLERRIEELEHEAADIQRERAKLSDQLGVEHRLRRLVRDYRGRPAPAES
jgi:hypothetical protein